MDEKQFNEVLAKAAGMTRRVTDLWLKQINGHIESVLLPEIKILTDRMNARYQAMEQTEENFLSLASELVDQMEVVLSNKKVSLTIDDKVFAVKGFSG